MPNKSGKLVTEIDGLPVRATTTKVIDMIDLPLLILACPNTPQQDLDEWVPYIKKACMIWGIDTVREVASFLANGSHESSGFRRLEENLNYSAGRLMQVWPSRFPNLTIANQYARNPEKLANKVYANRMGNGPPSSGDGWRHRGYGIFQLTGKRNQTTFAEDINMSLDEVVPYLRTKEGAAMSAGWYWFDNGLDAKAATPGIEDDRRSINGGLLGVDEVRNTFNILVAELLRRGA